MGRHGRDDAFRLARVLLVPGSILELRAIMRGGIIRSGYFDDPELLVRAAAELDGQAEGVYVTLNPVQPSLIARAKNRLQTRPKSTTGDADVLHRRVLLVDTDAKRPSGISATDSEKKLAIAMRDEIRTFLSSLGFPDPIVADSGNGGHLLYAIDLPCDDGGLVRRVLGALAFRFNTADTNVDETVFNPGRITKLYGTLACKGDNTKERPHRRSSIEVVPETFAAVPRELLERVAVLAPTDAPDASRGDRARSTERVDLEVLFARHGIEISRHGQWRDGERWVLATCPFNSAHADDSAYVVRFANGALAAGCHHNGCASKSWKDLVAILGIERTRIDTTTPDAGKNRRKRIPKYLPFPVRLFPEPVRSFILRSSEAIGCDPVFIALPLLAVAASAIGNTRRIRLKRGWSEASIIWSLLVAVSGDLKSPALGAVLRLVDELQRRALRDHEEDLRRYKARVDAYDVRRRKWINDGGAGDAPEKPVEPIPDRLYASDTTVEALAPLLKNRWRGILLFRDELSGWVDGFDQYRQGKGGDAAYWLEMHGARPLLIDRKTGEPRTIHVPYAAVSICGGIQPRVLARALGNKHFENGLAARFLLACPPRRRRIWTEAEIPAEDEQALLRVLERLYELEPDLGADDSPIPRDVDLTPEAKVLWIKFFDEHGEQQAAMTGNLSAAWSKLEGGAARLALTIHYLRWAGGGAADDPRVDVESIRAGIELSEWFGHETKRVYAILLESEQDQDDRALGEVIRNRGGVVSVRDWQRIRTHATATDAEVELQRLVDAGCGSWIYSTPGPRGGRPSKVFCHHPDETDRETPDDSAGEGVSSESEEDPEIPANSREGSAGAEQSPPRGPTDTTTAAGAQPVVSSENAPHRQGEESSKDGHTDAQPTERSGSDTDKTSSSAAETAVPNPALGLEDFVDLLKRTFGGVEEPPAGTGTTEVTL